MASKAVPRIYRCIARASKSARLAQCRPLSTTTAPRSEALQVVRHPIPHPSSPPLSQDILLSPQANAVTPTTAPRHRQQQPPKPLRLQRHQPETHRRDPEAVPAPIQKSSRDAAPRSRPAPARVHEHQRDE